MAKKGFWKNRATAKVALQAGLEALRIGGEAILTESIDETPLETGTLRRSGTVTVGALPDHQAVFAASEAGNDHKGAFNKPVGTEKGVYVSFSTPYARRQHEELGYHHPVAGKAKYLEDPFRRNRQKVLKLTEQRMRKALKDAE